MARPALTIGWIVANDELPRFVSLNDIPAYVKEAVE